MPVCPGCSIPSAITPYRLASVSYTHLDVYKRQVVHYGNGEAALDKVQGRCDVRQVLGGSHQIDIVSALGLQIQSSLTIPVVYKMCIRDSAQTVK